jgi:membrane protein implicated in regulation of membrane protease activity
MDWVTVWVLVAVAVLAIVGTVLWKRFYKPKTRKNQVDADRQREAYDANADIERARGENSGFGGFGGGGGGMGP